MYTLVPPIVWHLDFAAIHSVDIQPIDPLSSIAENCPSCKKIIDEPHASSSSIDSSSTLPPHAVYRIATAGCDGFVRIWHIHSHEPPSKEHCLSSSNELLCRYQSLKKMKPKGGKKQQMKIDREIKQIEELMKLFRSGVYVEFRASFESLMSKSISVVRFSPDGQKLALGFGSGAGNRSNGYIQIWENKDDKSTQKTETTTKESIATQNVISNPSSTAESSMETTEEKTIDDNQMKIDDSNEAINKTKDDDVQCLNVKIAPLSVSSNAAESSSAAASSNTTSNASAFIDEDSESQLESWKCVGNLQIMDCVEIWDLAYSPSGSHIICGGIGGGGGDNQKSLAIIDTKSLRSFSLYGPRGYVQGVAWDPIGEFVCAISAGQSMRVYQIDKGPKENGGFKFQLYSEAHSRNGKYANYIHIPPRIKNNDEEKKDTITIQLDEKKEDSSTNQLLSLQNQSNITIETSSISTSTVTPSVLADKYLVPSEFSVSHALFHDDSAPTFFRRLAFSPDGNFLVVPTGQFENLAADSLDQIKKAAENINQSASISSPSSSSSSSQEPLPVVYIFHRSNFEQPAAYLPCPESSIAIRFSPVFYRRRPSSDSSNNVILTRLPYRMIFAVACLKTVLIYDTECSHPLVSIRGLHLFKLTDLSWSHDGRILTISSNDGYVSVVKFLSNELGEAMYGEETEKIKNEIKEKSKALRDRIFPIKKNKEKNEAEKIEEKNSKENDAGKAEEKKTIDATAECSSTVGAPQTITILKCYSKYSKKDPFNDSSPSATLSDNGSSTSTSHQKSEMDVDPSHPSNHATANPPSDNGQSSNLIDNNNNNNNMEIEAASTPVHKPLVRSRNAATQQTLDNIVSSPSSNRSPKRGLNDDNSQSSPNKKPASDAEITGQE